MTDETEVVEHAARAGRDPRWRRWMTVVAVWMALSVLALAVFVALLYGRTLQLTQAQSDAATGEQQLAAQLRSHGVTPVVSPAAPLAGPAGPSGAQGPGPSQSQIDDAVNAYFVDHPLPPGQLPPVTEVADLVAQYLTAHPPAAGQNATPQMVSDAVVGYCSTRDGCAGATGQPGQNASDAQVADEVAAYCSAHNDCQGPAGANGQNGSNGTNGQPPVSWVAMHSDGSTETCTRSANFDQNNPTYDCTESTPSTTPTTTGSSNVAGLFKH